MLTIVQSKKWVKKTIKITQNARFPIICVLVGILCLAYPLTATLWNNHRAKIISKTYDAYNAKSPEIERAQRFHKANVYNNRQIGYILSDPYRDNNAGVQSKEYQEYLQELNNPTHIMAVVKIPKIGVKLPVYHGTSYDTLQRAAGHLYGSDLPIGGKDRHSVITAHTGLSSASMFDQLPQLVKGDFFYIDVLGETLRYRVRDIHVIEPSDISKLQRQPGRDLVTLLTCTPYGVNSHRLLVTGERVLPDPVQSPEDTLQWPWWMSLFSIAIICSILIALLMILSIRRKHEIAHGQHIRR